VNQTDKTNPSETVASGKRSLTKFAAIAISGLVLIGLLWTFNASRVWQTAVDSASWSLLLAALSILAVNIFFSSERFRQILVGMNLPATFWQAVQIRMGCSPIKLVTPFKAGEFLKPLYMQKRYGLDYTKGISVVVLDKITVLLASVPFLLVASLFSKNFIFIALAGIITLGSGLLFWKRFRLWMQKLSGLLGKKLSGFVQKLLCSFELVPPKRVLIAVGCCLALLTTEAILYYLVLLAVQVHVPFSNFFVAMIAAQFVGVLPIFVSGIGGREAVMVYYLGQVADPSAVLAAGILFTVFGRLTIHTVGLIWMPGFLEVVFSKKAAEKSFAPEE
jgi:uncharacterized protein (TIRG00374 family)